MTQPVDPQPPGVFLRAMQRMMSKITPVHVRLHRVLGGRFVSKGSGGAPVLLLTTTGRRTGQPRTVVVGHIKDGQDEIIAATNGGLEPLPSWLLNLQANPSCTIELASDQFDAEAEVLEGDEWEEQWKRLVKTFPTYDQAHRWAGRAIPLLRLRRS